MIVGSRPTRGTLSLLTICVLLALSVPAGTAWADADEYTGQAWNPTSTAAHPCGVGIPQRGNFPRDRWVNGRKPTVKLTVKQAGAQLCYVIDGIAEAPVIRVQQGQTLTVTVRNEITDPAALEKLLPVAGKRERSTGPLAHHSGVMDVVPGEKHDITGRTNLHVHGFAVPPVAPQDEVLMGCADPAVGPTVCGQREITYHYQIPPDMPPGLYWYHPHMHGEVQAQMLAGLTGAIVVEGPDDQARNDAGIPDRVFIVRQLQDTDGKAGTPAASGAAPTVAAMPSAAASQVPTPLQTATSSPPTRGVPITPTPPRPTALAATTPRIDTRHELGCTNTATVDEISLNGAPVVDGPAADKDLAPLSMSVGTTQLWRFVNAATDAFLDLALIDEAGKPVPIQVLARDGSPMIDDAGQPTDSPLTTEPQLVPPAGRIEFLVSAPLLDQKVYLVSHAVDTGCTGDSVPERRLGVLTALPYTADAAQQAQVPPRTASPNMFAGLLSRKTEHKRVIAFAEYPRPGDEDQTDFYIAERRPGVALVPYQMNGAPTITVPADSVEEWTVENWTNEVHAFHIHQVHFRVLSVNGQPVADGALLDTVTVPAAAPAAPPIAADVTVASQVAPGQVRIKLFFPESLAGDIPFHCHLVDHEDNGMMGVLRVIPRGGAHTMTNMTAAP
jgi:FtsP/CotA-like multicopper oxidase with cupredoxin domain